MVASCKRVTECYKCRGRGHVHWNMQLEHSKVKNSNFCACADSGQKRVNASLIEARCMRCQQCDACEGHGKLVPGWDKKCPTCQGCGFLCGKSPQSEEERKEWDAQHTRCSKNPLGKCVHCHDCPDCGGKGVLFPEGVPPPKPKGRTQVEDVFGNGLFSKFIRFGEWLERGTDGDGFFFREGIRMRTIFGARPGKKCGGSRAENGVAAAREDEE